MIEEHISRLYALPPSEFTAERNQLAKRLRSAGDRDVADEIKNLPKPSITAWAVNQLYREQRSTFDELLAAGRDQRRAVQSSADRLRSAGERKRRLQSELLKASEEVLAREGTRLSPALRQRISRTLDSLAAWPPEAEGPPLGRLIADLEPAGFDALLGATIAPVGKGKKRSAAAPARAGRPTATARRLLEEARSAVEDAQRELGRTRKEETAAKRRLTRAETRTERALEKAKAAELAAERAREAADAAQLELRKARTDRDGALQATERQEARLDTANRKLAELV